MQTGLISNALVIGAVDAAVYRTAEGLRALRLDENGGYVDCSRQAALLLDCPAEKRLLTQIGLDELKASLADWSRKQRLLQRLIGGMDTALGAATRRLGITGRAMFSRRRRGPVCRCPFAGCPLPPEADLDGARRLSEAFPRCRQFYAELAAAQEYIDSVARTLRELVNLDFAAENGGGRTVPHFG